MICPEHHTIEIPRFELKENVPCHEEFRNSMNSWLKDFFGVDNIHRVTGERVITIEDLESDSQSEDVIQIMKIARMFGLPLW